MAPAVRGSVAGRYCVRTLGWLIPASSCALIFMSPLNEALGVRGPLDRSGWLCQPEVAPGWRLDLAPSLTEVSSRRVSDACWRR